MSYFRAKVAIKMAHCFQGHVEVLRRLEVAVKLGSLFQGHFEVLRRLGLAGRLSLSQIFVWACDRRCWHVVACANGNVTCVPSRW